MRLQDRVAVVTGASSGIGRGIALALATEGARVVVADLAEEPRRGRYHERDTTTPTAAEIAARGGEALFVRVDVTDDAALAGLVEATLAAYGRLDILVNNAGVYQPGGLADLPAHHAEPAGSGGRYPDGRPEG
jgi:NAD(P)-dependent dehydrogenase (short-subunit alcohol dehydrogenase family)